MPPSGFSQKAINRYKVPIVTIFAGALTLGYTIFYASNHAPIASKQVQRMIEIRGELSQPYSLEKIVDQQYLAGAKRLVEEKRKIEASPSFAKEEEIFEEQKNQFEKNCLGIWGVGSLLSFLGMAKYNRMRKRILNKNI